MALPTLLYARQFLCSIPAQNRFRPFQSCLMGETWGVSSCAEHSLVTTTHSQYQRSLSAHAVFGPPPRSIRIKITWMRNFNFAFAILIRDQSRWWVTTWGRTGIYKAERRIHYHYLFKLSSIRRAEGWRESQPCFFLECVHHQKRLGVMVCETDDTVVGNYNYWQM